MKPQNVQEALKSLQQYLVDEYGWESKKFKEDSPKKNATPSEIARKLETEYLSSKLLKRGKTSL